MHMTTKEYIRLQFTPKMLLSNLLELSGMTIGILLISLITAIIKTKLL